MNAVDKTQTQSTTWCAGLRTLMLAVGLVLATLCPRAALAIHSIAVLDLDGYGIDYETAQVMTQGLRDGFLEEATFDPLSGYDISEGMSEGQGEGLRRARELLADARQKMDAGDPGGALRLLAEVLSIHEAAWSWVGRRPELSDAHFYTAVALAKLGRDTEAVDHLVECLYLYPGYDTDRATGATAATSLFSRARSLLEDAERRTISGARIATIGDRLQAQYVVAGYVVADGTVHLGLYQDGRLVTEATDYAEELPLYPGDPFFYDLAVRLVGGEHSAPAPGGYGGTIGEPSTTEPQFGDFHEIPSVEPDASGPSVSIGTSDGGHLTDQGSAYDSSGRPRRRRGEHTMSGIRYERKPVVETWWFWTGVTAVVAGGGVGLYLLLRDDGVVTPHEPQEQNSYTITLDPSGAEAR
jgi:hypothetical protein